jgi:prophage regulatory protein
MKNDLPRLMSPKEAAAETTFSAVQLTILSATGHFPRAVQLSARRIAYVRSEVTAWLDERIASRATH